MNDDGDDDDVEKAHERASDLEDELNAQVQHVKDVCGDEDQCNVDYLFRLYALLLLNAERLEHPHSMTCDGISTWRSE